MIRILKPSDIDAVMNIWFEFQYTSAFFYTKGILDEIFWASKEMLPDATVYVYEDNGSVQGFIGLTKNYIEGIL